MEAALVDEAPLVGRGAELDRIVVSLRERPSAAFVLAGAPGVGKTRLATEAARAASRSGFATTSVAASGSASSIPFGPFAPLLPEGATAPNLLELLRQASAAVLERAGSDGQLLLVVDDAHLLDEGSAALVNQLVRSGTCGVVATVRSLAPAPYPVTSLWKDGLAERLELDTLGETEVGQVAAGVLGGPVASASVRRLWEVSQGNALYLRELLAGAVDSGALVDGGGIWSLELPLTAPARLIELVAARLAGVAPETVETIHLVAAGEPLPLTILERLCEPAPIEDAERRGFVQLHRDGRRTAVRLAHPLYGETLRQTLPGYGLRRMSALLVDAVAATGARRREDLLRLAQWQLDAGPGESDPDLLSRAARRAIAMFDMALAERFAERAVDAGAGFDAGLVLGEARFRSGRLHEAESVLAALAGRCDDDVEIARVANARAYNLHTLIGDADAAARVLDEALAVVRDESARLRLLGRQATNRLLDGRPEEALAAATPLLAAPDDANLARGTYVASIALALLGRATESLEMASRGFDVYRRAGLTTQMPESQLLGAILAHTASGEFAKAEAAVRAVRDACLSAGDREGEATATMLGAFALVDRGRLTSASTSFLESAAVNRQLGDVTAIRWCLGGLAVVEGMRGRADRADAAVEELDGLRVSAGMGLYEFDVIERGRAWAAVARGEVSRALDLLRQAAGRAADHGQWVAEARLLHDVARLGDPASVASRLQELAAAVEGGLVAAAALHANALLSDSAAEVEAAALALEAVGAALVAAEAHLTAARRFDAERLLRGAAASSRRAQALLAECGEARTPGLLLDNALQPLTRREREIAGLAAAGASSREIASKLFLSVRTVDNHLQKVYGKLGVSSRAALAEALRDRSAGAAASEGE
jgi:DNA-binding CsgD family transcriptional regulator